MTISLARTLAERLSVLLLLTLTACSGAEPPVSTESRDVTMLTAALHRDHGWAALRAERYEQAASYFQRILKDLPEDGQAKLGLAEAYLGQGRMDEALETFRELHDQKDATLQAKGMQGQGIILLKQGDRETAARMLDDALRQDAGLWRSWNAVGRLRDADKDFVAAREAYRKAIDLSPKAAFLHNNLGFSFLISGEPTYAEAALKRALELDSGLVVAATNLRLALALQGRYEPALAGAQPQDRAAVMNNVGYAALLRGDRTRAKTLFRKAMATDPGFFGEARRNLAFLETLENGEAQYP